MSTKINQSLILLQAFIDGIPILLPSAAVAEIVDYTPPSLNQQTSSPSWYLGEIPWRGINIPLLALENFNHGASIDYSAQNKIAVMHFQQANISQPYWAFVVASTPRMHRINPQQLQSSDKSTEGNQLAAMWAMLNEEDHLILDFDSIETAVEHL